MTDQLASERIIINAPMSYAGSTQRTWRWRHNHPGAAWTTLAILLLTLWWVAITGWYLLFGLLLVPYRLLRRGARKRKAEALRHREIMAAVNTRRLP